MPLPLRHARATVLVGALSAVLLSGLAVDTGRADATPVSAASRTRIVCAGDAQTRPDAADTVSYDSLPGSSFAARASHAGGKVLRLGHENLRLRNFKPGAGKLDGGVLDGSTGGLVGRGAARSTVLLVPHSSTHKRDVPHVVSRTNQMSVLRVSGTARVLRGFLLRGTAQGHIYNGLRVDRVTDLRASHIKVTGIAGNEHQQPGETFGINDYRTTGSRWSHIVVDGLGVGASGFGANDAKDITICGSTARNNAVAMGFAFWQSSGIRLVDDRAMNNGFAGFNFERVTGTVTMIRPVAHGNRYNMRIASDRSSARFRIVDPKLVHGVWTIWMPKRWFGAPNKQKRSDITLIVRGKQRNDLLRFATY